MEISVCHATIRTAASLTLHLNQIILKASVRFHFCKTCSFSSNYTLRRQIRFFMREQAAANQTTICAHQIENLSGYKYAVLLPAF